jgi:hypothetical protein
MHNIFLGDLAHHIRHVLGIDADAYPPGEEHVWLHNPEEQQDQLNGIINALTKDSRTGLMRFCRGYIASVALANNIAPCVHLDVNYAGSAKRMKIPSHFMLMHCLSG